MSWAETMPLPPTMMNDMQTRTWAQQVTGNAIVKSVTTTYSAEATDSTILCNATGAAFTVTLPKAASCKGHVLILKKTDASGNAITVDGNGAETVDGAAQWNSVTVQSDGTNYVIIASV
jgi:hypothetical protein